MSIWVSDAVSGFGASQVGKLERLVQSPVTCTPLYPDPAINICLDLFHLPGDQFWGFIGKTDVEAETPILWPPDAKSWLIGKDPDAGKDWGQEEKGTTEDEMVVWHHPLNAHGFGWTSGVGDGQGGLACCSSWGRRESNTTERLNWTDITYLHISFFDAFQSCRHQNTSPKHFSLHTSKQNSYLFPAFFFDFQVEARGILVPWPGFEPMPAAVEAWSPNHWPTREVPPARLLLKWNSCCQQTLSILLSSFDNCVHCVTKL